MRLEGSCHCGAVRFSLECSYPYPYQRCYCGICRKLGGGGGYLINLGGDARTLEVTGWAHVKTYRALVEQDGGPVRSKHARHFCGECGAHLWAKHEDWPDLVHPVAAAIDTELPPAFEHCHIMLGSKASWVPVEGTARDERFDGYPSASIAQWHESRGLTRR